MTEVVQMLQTGQDDLIWFNSNITGLLTEFNNKFVAFRNKKVLESDNDLNSLISKLKNEGIDTSNIFIRFVSKVKYIL